MTAVNGGHFSQILVEGKIINIKSYQGSSTLLQALNVPFNL